MSHIFHLWVTFLVLLAPFFALSMFVLYTANATARERARLALKITFAVLIICLLLFFTGSALLDLAGITLDSFRVGAGTLLFLSAVSLVQGSNQTATPGTDIAVVPMAIPIIVGPATTGGILVVGAEATTHAETVQAVIALLFAIAAVGGILLAANAIERIIKQRGIIILSKLTGLFLSALASQMIFGGIKNILR